MNFLFVVYNKLRFQSILITLVIDSGCTNFSTDCTMNFLSRNEMNCNNSNIYDESKTCKRLEPKKAKYLLISNTMSKY